MLTSIDAMDLQACFLGAGMIPPLGVTDGEVDPTDDELDFETAPRAVSGPDHTAIAAWSASVGRSGPVLRRMEDDDSRKNWKRTAWGQSDACY